MSEEYDRKHEEESAGRLVCYAVQCLLLGLTTLTFTVLKLCKVIDWSWWWVMAPIWIPAAVLTLILVVCVIIVVAKGDD